MIKLPRCAQCDTPYTPDKSNSVLRLTYCTWQCEAKGLGFSIDAFMKNETQKKEVAIP